MSALLHPSQPQDQISQDLEPIYRNVQKKRPYKNQGNLGTIDDIRKLCFASENLPDQCGQFALKFKKATGKLHQTGRTSIEMQLKIEIKSR